MATINLGRIKPVFQGAYNASTAYVVDDIVTFGGESFISIPYFFLFTLIFIFIN